MQVSTHAVMGYFFARGLSKTLGIEGRVDYTLILFLSVLPDVDNFSPFGFATPFGHHGLSHSWILATAIALPSFALWGKITIPYYVAYVQHILVGDLLANAVPLLAPFDFVQYGVQMSVFFLSGLVGLEVLLVLVFVVYVRSDDPVRVTRQENLALLVASLPLFLLMMTDGLKVLFLGRYGRSEAAYSLFAIASGIYFFWLMLRLARKSLGPS